MNKRLFKIHPIMIPFLLFFYLSGEIALYAIVFGSLLFHELGHLLAAKLIGIKVNSCTILPYGGEISMQQFSKIEKKNQLFVIIAGPFFTLLLLIIGSLVEFPQKDVMLFTQMAILCLNLLPIYPLDGGRALYVFIPNKYTEMIAFSFCCSTIIFSVSLYYFPRALSISFIFLLLMFQNYSYWNFRKYKLAFEKLSKST